MMTKSAKSFYSIYTQHQLAHISNLLIIFRWNYHINLIYDNCNDNCVVPFKKLEIVNVEEILHVLTNVKVIHLNIPY